MAWTTRKKRTWTTTRVKIESLPADVQGIAFFVQRDHRTLDILIKRPSGFVSLWKGRLSRPIAISVGGVA